MADTCYAQGSLLLDNRGKETVRHTKQGRDMSHDSSLEECLDTTNTPKLLDGQDGECDVGNVWSDVWFASGTMHPKLGRVKFHPLRVLHSVLR